MIVRTLTLASANSAKMDLIAALVRETSEGTWQLAAADPGDAEQRAVDGYRPAAYAKAAALDPALHPVIGHDSGFEFACLGGEPGPLTARWLKATATEEILRMVRPRTEVRVVHCLTLLHGDMVRAVEHADIRRVRANLPTSLNGRLPLTALVSGPQHALRTCVSEVLAVMESV